VIVGKIGRGPSEKGEESGDCGVSSRRAVIGRRARSTAQLSGRVILNCHRLEKCIEAAQIAVCENGRRLGDVISRSTRFRRGGKDAFSRNHTGIGFGIDKARITMGRRLRSYLGAFAGDPGAGLRISLPSIGNRCSAHPAIPSSR